MYIISKKIFIRLSFWISILSIVITSVCCIIYVGATSGILFSDGIYFGDEIFMANALNITIILPICILFYLLLLFRKFKGKQDIALTRIYILLLVAVVFGFVFSFFLYNASLLEFKDSIWSIYGKLIM